MNNVVRNILIFTTGLAIGGFVAHKVTRKMDEEIIEEEIASVKEMMQRELQRKKERIIKDVESIDADESNDEVSATLTRSRERAGRTQYEAIVHKQGYGSGEDPSDFEHPRENDDEEYRQWEQLNNNARHHNPSESHMITVDEYNNEMSHYDKSTIYFYEDDEVLTDENEEVIENPTSIVGHEALKNFGYGSDDPEVVYARNDKLQIDYEVIRLSKSYSETVLGMEQGGSFR